MATTGKARSGPPSRETLYRLYVTEGLTCKEVGSVFGVTGNSAHRWLRALDIPTRTKAQARKTAKPPTYTPEGYAAKVAAASKMRSGITAESRAKQAEAIRGRPSPTKGKPLSEEHRQKLSAQRSDPEYRRNASERQKGAKGHNWKGGKDGAPINRLETWEWRAIRREVYARDNWLCQVCGVKCWGHADAKREPTRKIQAHHIIPRRDGGTDELANLVTLCVSCHHKVERGTAMLGASTEGGSDG